MDNWRSLPADLQALMEKRVEERRNSDVNNAPAADRRRAERRAAETSDSKLGNDREDPMEYEETAR